MGRVVFVLDSSVVLHEIDADNIYTSPGGLTGSELSTFKYAEGLASLGHEVVVLSRFRKSTTALGCTCVRFEERAPYTAQEWNAVVAVMHPGCVGEFKRPGLRVFNQQVNDFRYCPGWENFIDLVVAPSQVHANYLKTLTKFSNWDIAPNGVDPTQYTDGPRIEGRMAYISSPDRGLHWLLEAYPEIKRRCPNASLDIFYDWDRLFSIVRRMDNEVGYRIRYIQGAVERLRVHGVRHFKSVSRVRVAEELSRAVALAYPADTMGFTEGFSVSTLEATAAGCVPVIVGVDALASVYGGYIPCVKPPYVEHREEWIEEVCRVLSDEGYREGWRAKSKVLSSMYDWKVLVPKFEKMIGL